MIEQLKVTDVVSKDYSTVQEGEPLSKVIGKFASKGDPHAVLVFSKQRKFKGIIGKSDVMGLTSPDTVKASSVMRAPHKIQSTDSVLKAAEFMVENKIMHLPVFDKDKTIGVVREDDLVEYALEVVGNEPVRRHMTTKILTMSPETPLSKASVMMRKNGIDRIPVMEGKRVVGIVSTTDVMNALKPKKRQRLGEVVGEKTGQREMQVRSIMTTNVVFVPDHATIKEAVDAMKSHGFSSILVGREDNPTGIFTKTDALKPLARLREELLEQDYQLEIIDKTGQLDRFIKAGIDQELKEFAKKYCTNFNRLHFHVHLETQKEHFRRQPLFTCRVKLVTDRGEFYAVEEEWSESHSLHHVLEALKKEVDKFKGRKKTAKARSA